MASQMEPGPRYLYRASANNGWIVRHPREGKNRWFGDARYGGAGAALEAAVATRDRLIRQHGIRRWRGYRDGPHSNTSVTGLMYVRARNYLKAQWPEDGRQRFITRSLNAHTVDEAWWTCIETRARALSQPLDYEDLARKLEVFRARLAQETPDRD